MKRFLWAAALLLALSACREKPAKTDTEEPQDSSEVDTLEFDSLYVMEDEIEDLGMPQDHDEAFSDFFLAFVNNRRFQAERISFPLPVTDIDGTERTITSGRVFRSEFCMSNLDMYTLILTDMDQFEEYKNDIELEHARLQFFQLDALTERNYSFEREAGRWHLTQTISQAVADPALLSFLRFYHLFASDKLYQQAHLASSIHYSTPDPDDEMEILEGTIGPEQWEAFCPELPVGVITNIDFGQSYTGAHRIYLVQCGFSSGMFEVLKFERHADDWKLTAYEN